MPDQELNTANDAPPGVQGQGGDEPLREGRRYGPPRAHLCAGNTALVVLFACGVALLWVMSLRTGPSAAMANETSVQKKVDTALTELNASPVAGALPAVVNTEYSDVRRRQIPLARLGGNPFVFRPPTPPAHPEAPPTPASAPSEAAPEDGAARGALAAAQALKLQSVMMGKTVSAAIISNNVLTEGQAIQGWTLAKIYPRQVVLRCKDQTCVLKMPE